MQTASATIVTLDRDQRPWVAAQKAAGGVLISGRTSINGNNGKQHKMINLIKKAT